MKITDCKKSKFVFPLAIVVSRFNEEITSRLLKGALDRLQELDFSKDQTRVVWVPGAIEIPLVAQKLAQSGNYDAIICLGAVIQGETDHYDYICSQVSQGTQQVALQNDIPVIFGVLTTKNEEQALERAGGKMGNKGKDAIDTAVEMVCCLNEI